MDIASRLDLAMKAAGIVSQSALARASGIPQPTINRILKGVGKKGPEAHTLAQLAQACNVNFEWLHEGTGPQSRSSEITSTLEAISGQVKLRDAADENASVQVPFFEQRIHGGTPGFAGDDEFHEGTTFSLSREWVLAKGLDPAMLFAMKAAGLSMYPTIKPGDIVVLYRGRLDPVDGEIFGVNQRGKALLKRLSYEGGKWRLVSDNKMPEFPTLSVDEDTRIVGRLVTMQKDFI